MKLIAVLGAALIVATLSDAATAATIAGAFTIVNTLLTAIALRWLNQSRNEIRNTSHIAADAAQAAAQASEGAGNAAIAAAEACRVAKSIGSAIRHEDPLFLRDHPSEAPQ